MVIGDGITKIDQYAFWGFKYLKTVSFGKDLQTIGSNAFNGCHAMESITLPASLTKIGENAFGFCEALKKINIPDKVTEIGQFAFSDCSKLEEVTIGKNVTTIGDYVFQNCKALKTVYMKSATPPTLGSNIFYYCGDKPESIIVFGGSVEAYKEKYADWKDKITGAPGLELKHAFGDKATVTFYTYTFSDGEEPSPEEIDISSFTANNATTWIDEKDEMCDYVVAHIDPAAGYWTNKALLYASLMANETVAVAATRGADINGPAVVEFLQPDQGRNDGAGWYCFKFPEDGLMWNNGFTALAYKSFLLDGYVLPKFDLSKATVGTDGVTCTEGQWSTTLTIDESKSSFEYNGSVQGPTKLTNKSIIVKRGNTEAVTFTNVDDHVTASVYEKPGSSLKGGRAIDAGNYALTIKAYKSEAPVALDGVNTRASSIAIMGSGIFVNSKDVDFTITQKEIGLTWTPNPATFTYSGSAQAPTATATGTVNSDAISVTVTVDAKDGSSLTDGKAVKVGSYTATASSLTGDKAGNYKLPTAKTCDFTITAASATLSIGNVTKTYGDAAFTPTATTPSSGTITYTSGNPDVITIGSDGKLTIVAASTAPVTITANQAAAGDYQAATTTFTVTVNQKEVTVSGITASNKYYDGNTTATLITTAATFTDIVTGDNLTISATGTFDNKNAGTGKTVTLSNLTLGGTDAGNYLLATSGNQATTTADINPKEVTLDWGTTSSWVYDSNSHQPEATVGGLVSGDDCTVSTYDLTAASGSSLTTDGKAVDVGSYTVEAKALSNSNYKLPTEASKDFTITAASATLSIGNVTKTYGDAAFTPTATTPSSGTITYTSGNPDVITIGSDGKLTIVAASTAPVTITANQAAAGDYQAATTTFTVTVNQKEVELEWTNDTPYTFSGSAQAPTATAKTTSLIGSDACTVINYSLTATSGSLTNNEAVNAGSYAITATALSNTNYKLPISGVTQNFSIVAATDATAVVTANNRTYDGTAKALVTVGTITHGATGTASDVVFYESATSTTALAGIPQVTNAGSYDVYYEVTPDANHTAPARAKLTVTINKKALTIKAEAKSKVYGEDDPPLTYTSEGLVEGDKLIGALARAEGDNVGEYDITQGDLSAGENYTITFTPAKLTIKAVDFADGDVTAKGYEGTYDGKDHTIEVTAPESATIEYGIIKDLFELFVAPTFRNAGEHTIYYKVTRANTNPVYGSKTVVIKKAKLTITADPKEKVEGEADPPLTYTVKGLLEGDELTGALSRVKGESQGTYGISQGTLKVSKNYEVTFIGARFTIKPMRPLQTTYKIFIEKSEHGEVVSTMIMATPNSSVGLVARPNNGYHLASLVINKSGGSEVTLYVDPLSSLYFLMPASDVFIKATFEKNEEEQNIFIQDAKYGEIISHVIHADENSQVNLVVREKDGYENCVIDELKVFNEKFESIPIHEYNDPKVGLIYFFFMKGEKAYVFNTFKGTNGIVDESNPLPPDNLLYLMNNDNLSFLNVSGEANDVQLAMSLVANILATFTPEGELQVRLGEDDLDMALLNLKSGWQIKIDFTGDIRVLNPNLLEGLGADGTIEAGVLYKMLADGNLELLLKSSMLPQLIKSITIIAPVPDDPTAISRLQADDADADIYDLSGRKVDSTIRLPKGVYIKNGKKIVIK